VFLDIFVLYYCHGWTSYISAPMQHIFVIFSFFSILIFISRDHSFSTYTFTSQRQLLFFKLFNTLPPPLLLILLAWNTLGHSPAFCFIYTCQRVWDIPRSVGSINNRNTSNSFIVCRKILLNTLLDCSMYYDRHTQYCKPY
jgi:hypothetical protein